jgi:hypothetical protein
VREQGGPQCFKKARKAWQQRIVTRRRTNLVKHYEDLATLGRDFETQAFLAGLNPSDCVNLRATLESPGAKEERLFTEEADRQLWLLSRLLPFEREMTDEEYKELCLRWTADPQARLDRLDASPPLTTNQTYAAYKQRARYNKCYDHEKLAKWIRTWPSLATEQHAASRPGAILQTLRYVVSG